MKQCCVLLNAERKVIAVLEIKTFKDDKAYFELKENAELNAVKEHDEYLKVCKRLGEAEKEIKILKVENKYDRGEITKEEMLNLIENIKGE